MPEVLHCQLTGESCDRKVCGSEKCNIYTVVQRLRAMKIGDMGYEAREFESIMRTFNSRQIRAISRILSEPLPDEARLKVFSDALGGQP